MSCLIIIERGVSEKNNIAALTINRGLKPFFKSLKSKTSGENALLANKIKQKDKSSIITHGVSHEISLTSVLLGTLLDRENIPFTAIDSDSVLVNYGEYIKEMVKDVKVVALSTTYTINIKTIETILAFIRKHSRETNPGLKIVLGGQSMVAWMNNDYIGQNLFEHLGGADYFVFGEADNVFGPLVRKIMSGESVAGIGGVVVKNGSGIEGAPEKIMVDADEIASPNWDILRKYDFNKYNKKYIPQSVGIEEGRGCTFKCKFCSYSADVLFRRKTPEKLVEELNNVHKNGITGVSFLGAEFINPIKFSIPTLQAIAELDYSLDIWAFGRLDLISANPQIADHLKKANFTTIQFGLESGSPKILKIMNKRFDPVKMSTASRLLKERNIHVKVSIIIGFPGETEETLQETMQILKESNFEEIMIHGLVVLPGTPLYKDREKYGIKMTPYGWAHDTMAITDLPRHIQSMIIFLTRNTDTFILNIAQNITPKFFNCSPSDEQIRQATKILQKIICHEWDENVKKDELEVGRRELLDALLRVVDHVPDEYL